MRMTNRLSWLRFASVVGIIAASAWAPCAHAGLFDDEEARKAILELRQRVEANRLAAEQAVQKLSPQFDELGKRITEESKKASEDAQAGKRGALELTNQLEALRADLSRQRGVSEQLSREVAEAQRRQKDVIQALEERLRKLEPQKVAVDGREFFAEPSEKREFDSALAVFRRGDFAQATNAFGDFSRRYAGSGYLSSALFWLGNAQYATKDYKESVNSFREMLKRSPDHPRAAEAMLGVANALVELKDAKSARTAYQDLVTAFPQSEAAASAKDKLTKLR